MNELDVAKLDWSKGTVAKDTGATENLLPAIVQDAQTGKVLMLGYMNKEALQVTQASKQVTFYSRSKQRLWTKGETSGHVLQLVELFMDCDQDALLSPPIPLDLPVTMARQVVLVMMRSPLPSACHFWANWKR
jgi:phosphoribosyl-ATP pyrophosphohydrolase/phosphoribosyl-AMP cyclohydrolase